MERRPIIGVVVSGIADMFSVDICRGIVRKAKRLGVDVVLLPGKYIDRQMSARNLIYEYQYNTLFSYAWEKRVDAVVMTAGSIGCYASAESVRQFVARFSDVPCVLMGCKQEGVLSVNYDNYQGIRDGLQYLIHEMSCKHFLMIGGPDDNTDAAERKAAFFEVLQEAGISADDDNFIRGDLAKSQQDLVIDYLNTHPQTQAIFCVNDATALSVYDALKEQGIVPGRDIYLMGYDNTIQGAKAKPALSTVMADAGVLGERALELVLDALDGKSVESVVLPTKFVRRESFGTGKRRIYDVQMKRLDREYIDDYYEDIFYRYDTDGTENRLYNMYRTIMEHIIDSYAQLPEQTGSDSMLLKLVDTFLLMGAIKYADTEKLLEHVEEISRIFIKKYLSDASAMRLICASQEGVYRAIILVEEQQQGTVLAGKEQKTYELKTFVTASMCFERGSDQSYGELLANLDWLNVKNADLFIFNKPLMHLEREKFQLPRHIYLKASLRDGQLQNGAAASKRVRTLEIFRRGIFTEDSHVKVALPIFSNENIYGLLVCDMTEKMYENGEFLVSQIGVVAKMIHLLKMNADIQMEYEKSLVALKENNIALDALAKSDGLTGILNRRGYMEAAERMLQANKQQEQSTVVAYIDMNNLKIVNDRYGHDEGDFSIQLISRLLREGFADGIVGRIGGDEFSLISPCKESMEQLICEIYQMFTEFNQTSDKEYNITVSVGACIVGADEKTDLTEALAIADEQLYLEKQKRVKSVAKEQICE